MGAKYSNTLPYVMTKNKRTTITAEGAFAERSFFLLCVPSRPLRFQKASTKSILTISLNY